MTRLAVHFQRLHRVSFGIALSLALGWRATSALASPQILLSELEPISAEQDWGELAVDRSVWNKPLQIGDRKFDRGLGTHANSELVYALEKASDRFEAWVGVDAAMAAYPGASVVFKVVADGRELFNSGVMRGDTPAKRVSVDVSGVDLLKLIVADAGDGINADHADWAEAVLRGTPKTLELEPVARPAKFTVRAPGLALDFSDQGEIVKAKIGRHEIRRAVQGATVLSQCTNAGTVLFRELGGGGLEFTRELAHALSGKRLALTERFQPSTESIRWEIEICGEGEPWSTGIETRLRWPATNNARFWTPWDDPEQKRDVWRDPLVLRPLADTRLWYGATHWDEEHPHPGYQQGHGNRFVIPLVTVAEPGPDIGLSVVLSPQDQLLEMSLTTRKSGLFTFSRNDHRIAQSKLIKFALDLVGHKADWRCGLAWMTRRYAPFFDPPNPRADLVAGLAAYSDWEGDLDVARLKRMGFRVNWKASYDFPYMGMFLPPTADSELYPRFAKTNQTSIRQLRDYSHRMRQLDFHVLNYFNVTEFGGSTGMPKQADPSLTPADCWKNVNNFLYQRISDAILRDLAGREYGSWEGCIAMDCAAPNYHAFLLEQARRHLRELPDSSGICIDRMDWLRFYNFRADDALSWRRGQPCRSLYESWRGLLAELGPMVHAADKVIFVNALVNRTDLMRQVDGIYHEIGHVGAELNGAALQCVRKPCLVWTPDEHALEPDPDAYFQRHLYLGAFPTAPLPANDHTINPNPVAEKWYLDYGPLFDALRGKKWLLVPGVVKVQGEAAKANVFEVPGGYVLPVTFGGTASSVTVSLARHGNLAQRGTLITCEALYPGTELWTPLKVQTKRQELRLNVPLQRGCAMVRVRTVPY